MFQILEFSVAPNERVVIDDKLKTQYKGITGMTVWTPDHNKLRPVNLEVKIDGRFDFLFNSEKNSELQVTDSRIFSIIFAPAPENINRIRIFDMKKTLISLIVALTAISSFAQTQANAESDSIYSPHHVVVYRLYPTQNMWTFIKLNTRTGQMWQVQYSTKGDDYRFETYLNLLPLVLGEEEQNGRFTLYPTQNMWTFILLDQIDGRTWQVQWSTEAENRLIEQIKKIL